MPGASLAGPGPGLHLRWPHVGKAPGTKLEAWQYYYDYGYYDYYGYYEYYFW